MGTAVNKYVAGCAKIVCPKLAGGTLTNAGAIPASHHSSRKAEERR